MRRGALPAFAFLCAASAAAAETPADKDHKAAAREHFLRAREAEREGRDSAALSRYSLAFRADPRSRDLCFLYLGKLKEAGAVDSSIAVGAACEALAAEPAFAERKLLGEVALRAEDPDAALRHFREARRLDPGNLEVLYALVTLHEARGDWDAWAEALEDLIPRLGYPPPLLEQLARVQAFRGRVEAVIPLLEDAWRATERVEYGRALAAHHEARGLHLSQLRVARRLAEIDPSAEHDVLLARAFHGAHRPDSAIAVAARALKAEPRDPGLRYMHASLLYERGRYREALKPALKLAREYPEEAVHHQLAGAVELELGRSGAIAAFERARDMTVMAPGQRARLAYADYAVGRPDRVAGRLAFPVSDSIPAEHSLLLEGLAHGQLARDLEPRGAWERPAVFSDSGAARRHREEAVARFESILAKNSGHRAALFEAGAHLERLGERERSKELMSRLVARDSNHALALNFLGYTLIERAPAAPEDLERAGRLLARAAQLAPENGAVLDSKGWWHYRAGNPDSARAWLERALDAIPGDPEIHEHYAEVLHALGDRDAACAAARALLRIDPARRALLRDCPEGEAPDASGAKGKAR